MRSYWIPFLLALGVHLLFLCSFNPFIERPENGLAKGLSSLEVVLTEAPQEKKPLPYQRTFDSEKVKTTRSTVSARPSALQQQDGGLPRHYKQPALAASGAMDVTPSYLHNPQPLYPEKERQAGHEGTVLLRISISEQGTITHLVIEHSSGYSSLDDQAAKTVKSSWTFRPAHRNGKAISSTVLVPIHFSLKN